MRPNPSLNRTRYGRRRGLVSSNVRGQVSVAVPLQNIRSFIMKRLYLLGALLVGFWGVQAGTLEGEMAAKRGDYKLALEEFVRAASNGDAEAANYVGWMYLAGRGVPTNYGEALRWYRLAAQAGHRVAQNNLGHMYRTGLGVTRDFGEARRLFEKSVEQGYPEAKANLALLYCNGEGVPKDLALCAKWNREAANDGNAQAQFAMAVLSIGGAGIPKDEVEALWWAEKAAAQGHAGARTWVRIMQKESQANSSPNPSVNTDSAR